jgi:hypothetical protein
MARMPDPAKRAEWRRRLLEFHRGNWTVAAFCRRLRVSPATFYQWKRKLSRAIDRGQQITGKRKLGRGAGDSVGAPVRSRDRGQPTARLGSGPPAAPPVRFIPIELTGQPSIEVHLANGTRLLVPCREREAIRTVIGALLGDPREDRAC